MEVEYGIGITNRFAFLYKDIDKEEEYLTSQPKVVEPKKKNAAKSLTVDVKPVEKKTPKSAPGKACENKQLDVRNRKDKENKSLEGRKEKDRFFDDRKENKDNNRSWNRPRRNDRSPRDGYPQNNRNGAPFRRRDDIDEGKSVTEVAKTEKMPEPENEGITETTSQVNDEEVENNAEGNNGNEEKDDESKKVESVTFTLTEWKAMQATREKPVFNVRKAGEGEDVAKFGKMILKKKETADKSEDEVEMEEVYYPQRAGRLKQVSDVGFTTGYQRRRGGGGRGGGIGGNSSAGRFGAGDGMNQEEQSIEKPRGDRGGRGPRGGRGGFRRAALPPRINDDADFPTLS